MALLLTHRVFTGFDSFNYQAVYDTGTSLITSEATVTLTACTGGPTIFACWQESAYLAKLGEHGYSTFQEGFENDAVWGAVRQPNTAPSVTSKGIQWMTNHLDPPASNEITTASGPAHTGGWGIYDPSHGYATGTPAGCDVEIPPDHCLYHDRVTGIREAGASVLHGAGGFITGTWGAKVSVILDGTTQIGFGQLPDTGHHFFGVIDAGPTGFSEFEFREMDGKVGQAL